MTARKHDQSIGALSISRGRSRSRKLHLACPICEGNNQKRRDDSGERILISEPAGLPRGRVLVRSKSSRKSKKKVVTVLHAGQIAERIASGRRNRIGAASDSNDAVELALKVCGSGEAASLLPKNPFTNAGQQSVPWPTCYSRRRQLAGAKQGN